MPRVERGCVRRAGRHSDSTSIGCYNPVVMSERAPGMVDWVEDLISEYRVHA